MRIYIQWNGSKKFWMDISRTFVTKVTQFRKVDDRGLGNAISLALMSLNTVNHKNLGFTYYFIFYHFISLLFYFIINLHFIVFLLLLDSILLLISYQRNMKYEIQGSVWNQFLNSRNSNPELLKLAELSKLLKCWFCFVKEISRPTNWSWHFSINFYYRS